MQTIPAAVLRGQGWVGDVYDCSDAYRVYRAEDRNPERGENMEKSKERLMKLDKEALVEKIWNERIAFRDRYERMKDDLEKKKAADIATVRMLCDQIICRTVRSYGRKNGDEYVLDIPVPDCPEGKLWSCKVKQEGEDTWRLVAKLFDISEMEKATV